MRFSNCFPVLATGLLLTSFGCQEAEPPPSYAKNLVYEYVVEQMAEQPFGAASGEIQSIVIDKFGDPLDRKVPEDFADLIDVAKLDAGATAYDRHCAACHGLNGDGRGPVAALLTPYPRDYRPGVFKFKSSLPGEKPLVEDIVTVIQRGVPGTAMKPIPELTAEDRDAIANYVVYLSARGEYERLLMLTAGFDFDLEGGEKYYPPEPMPEDYSGMEAEEADELVTDLSYEILDPWLDTASFLEEVEVPEFLTAASDAEGRDAAVKRGKELFATREAACSSCHREDKDGNIIPADKPLYDVWGEEWTTRIGLDPKDEPSLVPIIARGALPPREALPRRLGHEPLRGGDDPRAIFAKIKYGIDGTPMPKATLNADDVWDLVAYILARTAEVPEDPNAAPTDSASPEESQQASAVEAVTR